jgi:hypothetical protein
MSNHTAPKANELVDVFTRASGRFDQEEGIRRFGHIGCRLVEAAGLHPPGCSTWPRGEAPCSSPRPTG